MEKSDIAWAIKSNDSRFVYINRAGLDFSNIPLEYDYEGRFDEEFPCAWSELAPEFKAHDRKAESSPQGAEIITTSYFTRNSLLEPWYCHKFPIYGGDDQILGTLCYCKRFSFFSTFEFFANLKPSVITLNPPVDIFTERELEIIFYAIQKFSAKEIALKLIISHRTVENRLLRIYEKIGVNSINGLIEYCHNVGLNNYVPKKLLREGVNFCW
nr:PAS and helix-turn-helix domain-containing protein [Sodalis praecaptivus]